MSERNVEAVRQRVAVKANTRRSMEEQLGLRFPAALRFVVRTVQRLPPRSRLRQAQLRRAIRLASEATNRGDLDAAFMLILSPDYEVLAPEELVRLGFDPVYRGREGRKRYHETWIAELGSYRLEPEEIIDQGDRVLVLARAKGAGLSSGADFDDEVGILLTVQGGQLIREQNFRSHMEAFQAAGLSE